MAKWGLLGAGNMGGALLEGAISGGALRPSDALAFDAVPEKARELARKTGATIAHGAKELAEASDAVLLAVKPKDAFLAASSMGDAISGKLLVSVALGFSLEAMARATGGATRCIRAMPNTPALVGEGVTCIAFGESVTDADRSQAESFLSSVGIVEPMSEEMLESVTALTGSSPAYVFMLLEAMSDAAVHDGLPRDIAGRLAAQAVLGSAKLARDDIRHPAELKDTVCSPAGSTIAAVRELESRGFRGAVIAAMIACNERARAIAHQQQRA